MTSSGKIILALSLTLAALIIISSCIGIFSPDFYNRETLNWQVQSTGQDLINFFLVAPFLLITSVLVYKNFRSALSLWAGSILYLIYTYMIYCFDIHFNGLFVIYCLILGLSFYSMLYFIYLSVNIQQGATVRVTRVTAIYFIIISVLFYFLWLSEIIPPLTNGSIPKSLSETGLPTNPVHIIDLSVFLPGLFITALLLLKRNKIGYMITPLILVFFILMDITIGFLILLMKTRGLDGDLSLVIIMSVLAAFSSVLLIIFLKGVDKIKLFTNRTQTFP